MYNLPLFERNFSLQSRIFESILKCKNVVQIFTLPHLWKPLRVFSGTIKTFARPFPGLRAHNSWNFAFLSRARAIRNGLGGNIKSGGVAFIEMDEL